MDSEIYQKVKQFSTKEVILAGGIKLDNIEDILKETGAKSIDIMTGVEKIAGEKDSNKIEQIMKVVVDYKEKEGE